MTLETSARRLILRTWAALSVGLVVAAASCATGASDTDEPREPESSTSSDSAVRDCAAATDEGTSSVEQLAPFRATGPIATADGREVSARTFNLHVLLHPPRARRNMPGPMIRQIKRHTVREVVAFDLAAHTSDVAVPAERIDDALRTFRSRTESSEDWNSFLDRHAVDVEDIRLGLCRKLLVEAYVRKRADLDVDDQTLRQYYRRHTDSFTRPDQDEPPPFSEVRERVTTRVRSRRLEKSRRELFRRLRREADVTYQYDSVETTLSGRPDGRSLPTPTR